jgi:hypothetical protein
LETKTDELEKRINAMIALVEKLPEPYRLKAFEILMTTTLQKAPTIHDERKGKEKEVPPTEFRVPIDVRAFLTQYGIEEQKLRKLFFISGTEVRPIYNIKSTKKAKAQIHVAALTALENALQGGKFEFSVEAVRLRVQEQKCYDGPNFMPTFNRNVKLFRGLDDKEHVELSPDGKSELADAISEIAV